MRLTSFRVNGDSIAILIDQEISIILGNNKEIRFENIYKAREFVERELNGDLYQLCPSLRASHIKNTLDTGNSSGRHEGRRDF